MNLEKHYVSHKENKNQCIYISILKTRHQNILTKIPDECHVGECRREDPSK